MNHPPPCELVSWKQVGALCRTLVRRIRDSSFAPDLIIAIGRGGYVPARIVADLMGLMDLVSIRVEHYHGTHKVPVTKIRQPLAVNVSGRRILLLDDVSDTGETFEVALNHVRECGKPQQIKTAALHHKTVSRVEPDFFGRKIVKWRWIIYPWAVVEDLTAFTRDLQPAPTDPADLGRSLWQKHGIRTRQDVLTDVFALLETEQGHSRIG